MRWKYVVISCMGLAACQPTGNSMQTKEQQDVAECTRLGFTPQTDAFANCRLELSARTTVTAPDEVQLIRRNSESIRNMRHY